MAKDDFVIARISKTEAGSILLKYHYLKDISRGFKSGENYGLFLHDELVGVAIFTGFPVPELVKGLFGLPRTEQEGFYELSRLCLSPDVQASEYNITSWFLARSIRQLRRDCRVRSILSYADSDFHLGTIYRACNFKYYGLTDPKSDFWILQPDGSFLKHSRGPTRNVLGEWRPRSRKHRFLLVFDRSLSPLWSESD